jgi:hypothetical protein
MNTIGVVTVKILTGDVTKLFLEAEESFPEFLPKAKPYVLGGFAAYANPSSFHCPFVKNLRKNTFETVFKSGLFQKYLAEIRPNTFKEFNCEVLFDRILHRFPGQKPSPETAHRDVTPGKFLQEENDDLLFGGWLNLTDKEQFFVGQPGSHLGIKNTFEVSRSAQGFCTLDTKSDEYRNYQLKKQTFSVPPGHLIIFPQHLIHEVLAKSSPHEQFRLFFGWRLTKATTPLFPDKEVSIDTLGVPKIPSGQIPAIFSSHHQSLFKNKAFQWSGPTGSKGTLSEWWEKTLRVPFQRRLNSLDSYKLDYFSYSIEEKNFLLTNHPLFN